MTDELGVRSASRSTSLSNPSLSIVTLAERGGMILWLIVSGGDRPVSSASPSYKGHRYPVGVISHCVAVLPVPAQPP